MRKNTKRWLVKTKAPDEKGKIRRVSYAFELLADAVSFREAMKEEWPGLKWAIEKAKPRGAK